MSWTTDQTATSEVDYGLTNGYGGVVTNASLVLNHSLTLGSLACNTVYHYRIKSVTQAGGTATTSDSSFMTGPCAVAGSPGSDDFHGSTLNTGQWSFYANCCGFVKMTGTDDQARPVKAVIDLSLPADPPPSSDRSSDSVPPIRLR